MISNIDGLDLETIKEDSKGRDAVKFKKHSQDAEILYEIYENDKLARDLYDKICTNTFKEFIEEIWKRDDPAEFFEILDELIQEEQDQID